MTDEITFLDTVTEILKRISTGDLQRIFRSWIELVENVIPAEGAMPPSKYPAFHYLI
jgi:hypothetical protein